MTIRSSCWRIQAAEVSASRSGKRSTTRRLSRFTKMVPKRQPRMTGKIVYTEKKDHSGRAIGQSHDATEKRLASGLYSQPRGQSDSSFTTGRKPDGGDLLAVPDRHPRPGRNYGR